MNKNIYPVFDRIYDRKVKEEIGAGKTGYVEKD